MQEEKNITEIINEMNLDLKPYNLTKISGNEIECNNYILLQSGNIYTLTKIDAVKTSVAIDITGTIVFGLPSMMGKAFNIHVFSRYGLAFASYYSVDDQGKKQFLQTESIDNIYYGKEMLF